MEVLNACREHSNNQKILETLSIVDDQTTAKQENPESRGEENNFYK